MRQPAASGLFMLESPQYKQVQRLSRSNSTQSRKQSPGISSMDTKHFPLRSSFESPNLLPRNADVAQAPNSIPVGVNYWKCNH